MKRREFVILPASTLLLKAQQKVPLRFFTAEEAKAITAAAERILPADAAVVIYIDRQLAGPHGRDKYRYTKGPWVKSVPEHGNQDKATPQQIYREGIPTLGPDFAAQSPEEQDRRLTAIEKTPFFAQLRAHTIEGMFCDPLHGGNANLVGWKMINFPGPVMSYRLESELTAKRTPKSLEQITGRKIQGWEDEV
jgi:gluconate 2-dehydrogenase gamma chain